MSDVFSVPVGGELVLSHIVGSRLDADLGHRLHHLAHHGAVEELRLAPRDMTRKRLRARTDRGTACMIALPRDDALFDGAILLLEAARAIVVRSGEERWLRLRPANAADALALGYAAGNLHWKVRFHESDLEVALEGEPDRYLSRIRELLDGGRVRLVADEAG